MRNTISVKGAKEHNLQNIDIEIPRNQLVVVTGVSGSGKSSLAFDTVYAEGQRRFLESLSAYSKKFVDQVKKPKVDFVMGLVAGGLYRTKNHDSQPPFDGGHYDRHL